MKKLLTLCLALIATTTLWASNTINYTAAEKLEGYCGSLNVGKTTFGPAITLHTFSNGKGTITCSGEISTIGEGAFRDCKDLTSVIIPNSVTTIGDYAFQDCRGLTSITIPNSVTTIGERTFEYCVGLASIIVESNNIVYDSRGNCNAIIETATNTLFQGCKNTIIPNSVIEIGYDAFSGCTDLTSITIPYSVTTIGDWAFCNCSGLTSITIPSSITSIGSSVFYGCSGLISITIPNSVTTIREKTFFNCTNLTSIIIPNSITSIGGYAFRSCENLKTVYNDSELPISKGSSDYGYVAYYADKVYNGIPVGDFVIKNDTILNGYIGTKGNVTIPNSVTTIEEGAFRGCSGLTSVMIGNSVTTIGNYAFRGCSGLTSITIPNSVTTIGEKAFYNCIGLKSIQFDNTVPPIFGGDAFYNVPTSATISVPCGCVLYYKYISALSQFKNYSTFGDFSYILSVSSSDDVVGSAEISNASDCITNEATIKAIVTSYGYHFDHWSDGYKDNPHTIVITKDSNLVAYFAKNVYIVTTYASNGQIQGNKQVEYLDTCTLTATPDYGYHFTQWSDGNTDNPRTIQIVSDTVFTAEFAKNSYSFEVKANDDERGSVEGINGTYEYQTRLTIRATARMDLGYHFAQWSDGNTNNPRTLTLTENTVLVAQFEENKCGNDLMWYLKENELLITGAGAMYDYGFISWSNWASQITSISLPEGLTHIGANAFKNCSNVQKVEIPTTVTSIGDAAFYDCIGIRSITCFAKQVPIAGSHTFYGLSQYTKAYVLASLLEDYQFAIGWRDLILVPMGADVTPISSDTTIVTSSNTDVTITWPVTNGTDTYTLTITKNDETVCVLTFNGNGQLTNIAFAAPGHNGAHQAPAATLTAQGYQFTVTGLNPGTAYDYSVTATNAGGQTLAEHKGNFSTTGGGTPTSINEVHGSQCSMHKVLRNGQIILEQKNATYTLMGQKVR